MEKLAQGGCRGLAGASDAHRRLRLTEKLDKQEIGRIIDEWMCRPPRRM